MEAKTDGMAWQKYWMPNDHQQPQLFVIEFPKGMVVNNQYSLYLDDEFGALDVGDERHRVIDGHAAGAVALRDEGRGGPGPSVPHRQVDDEVQTVLHQVVGDRALVHASLAVSGVFIRPVNSLHLQNKLTKIAKVWNVINISLQYTNSELKLSVFSYFALQATDVVPWMRPKSYFFGDHWNTPTSSVKGWCHRCVSPVAPYFLFQILCSWFKPSITIRSIKVAVSQSTPLA